MSTLCSGQRKSHDQNADVPYGTPSFILELEHSATMENLLATLEMNVVKESGHKSSHVLNDVEKILKKTRKTRSVTTKDFGEVNLFLQTLLDLVSKLNGIYKASKAGLVKHYEDQIMKKDNEIQSLKLSSGYSTRYRYPDETEQWYKRENHRLRQENQELTKNLKIQENRHQRGYFHPNPWQQESNQSDETLKLRNKLAESKKDRERFERECMELRFDKQGLKQKILKLDAQVSDLNDTLNQEKEQILRLKKHKREMEVMMQPPQRRQLKGRTGQNTDMNHTQSLYDNDSLLPTPYQGEGHQIASEYVSDRLGRSGQVSQTQNQRITELLSKVARMETDIAWWQTEDKRKLTRIKNLERDVNKTHRIISDLANNVSKKENLNKQYSERIHVLEVENDSLRKQQGEVQRLGTEIKRLSEQVLFAEATLSEKDKSFADLKHNFDLKCSELHRLQRRKTALQESVNQMNQEKLTQVNRITLLEHDLKHSQSIVVELQQDTMNKENILRASKQEFDNKEGDILKMRALCDQKEREISTKKHEVEQLHSEIQRLQPYESAVSKQDAMVRDLQHKITKHTAELDQMKLMLSEKDQINQNLQQCITSKDSEDVKIQNLQKHVTHLLTEENELKGKIKQLKNENKKCYASNDRLHEDCFTKERQISRLEEQLSEEGRVKKQLEERIEREMEVASQQRRIAKQDLELHEKERLKQANKIRQLELRLQDCENNMEDYQGQEQELKDMCSRKDRDIMLKQQELDRLKAEFQNLSQELRQMKLQVSAKDKPNQDLQQLERQVQKLMSQVTEKNEKLKKLNNEKNRCYASNERLHRESCAKDAQISQLTEQLSKEEERMKEQSKEKIAGEMKVKNQLQRRIADQDSQIRQLQENVENLKQRPGKRTTNREAKEMLQR